MHERKTDFHQNIPLGQRKKIQKKIKREKKLIMVISTIFSAVKFHKGGLMPLMPKIFVLPISKPFH